MKSFMMLIALDASMPHARAYLLYYLHIIEERDTARQTRQVAPRSLL